MGHSSLKTLLPFPLLFVFFASFGAVNAAAATDLQSVFYALSNSPYFEFTNSGQEILLFLDQANSSGISSYESFLFGAFTMHIKLWSGDSAGTVTSYYCSSFGPYHDELDFEFLGNVSGQPIILQTNVYSNGVGNREQRIFLWFDPTVEYHNYTFVWNAEQVVFVVDNIPVRVFPNTEKQTGVPYLKNQHMNVLATFWNGEDWATDGGAVKTNWTYAPFIAYYTGFVADACASQLTTSSTSSAASACLKRKWWNSPNFEVLDASSQAQLDWVKKNYMVYDYCNDYARFNGTPPECFYTAPTIEDVTSAGPASSPTITYPQNSVSPSPSPSSVSPSLLFSISFLFRLRLFFL